MTRPHSRPVHRRRRCRLGFTMLELLTTLIIILVLVGILLPVVKKMREKAQEAAVKAQLSSLDSAINSYYTDFHAYPGPLSRSQLYPLDTGSLPVAQQVFEKGAAAMKNISGSENLTLALLGGLAPHTAGGFEFDTQLLSRGPRNLHPSNPKSYKAYVEGMILSEGLYRDGAGTAIDSPIPEIMDKFSNSMPILYLRAQSGAKGVVSNEGRDTTGTPVNGLDANNNPIPTQYDIREVLSYTDGSSGSIGEGKSISFSEYKNVSGASSTKLLHGLRTVNEQASFDKGNANYTYPYDAFPYFSNPQIPPTDTTKLNQSGTSRNKDRYILISAGVDRVFGTPDDITNAGSVLE